MPKRRPLKNVSHAEFAAWLQAREHEPFRQRQVSEWMYRKWCVAFEEMRNLPRALRAELAAEFDAFSLHCVETQTSRDRTVKYLLALRDGETIETVLISAPRRTTVCVSSQAGCPVRCSFCASGRDGWKRDLCPSEIIDQVVYACRELGQRVGNVVVMGIGEPLLNLDNLIPALDAICDPDRLGIGARHVTVSTSGIVPGIYRLADLGRQWHLALSLHAASDSGRKRLIPRKYLYPLSEILAACAVYRRKTGRLVTLEYTLIAGRNDTRADMLGLAQTARDLDAKLNLIPCNPGSGPHRPPPAAEVQRFLARLQERGAKATVRREKGTDIQAACGQLRLNRQRAAGSTRM